MQTPFLTREQESIWSDGNSLWDDRSTSGVGLEKLKSAALCELLMPIVFLPGKSIIHVCTKAEPSAPQGRSIYPKGRKQDQRSEQLSL